MKIFQMNDCDWWMAETAEIAERDYVASGHGLPREEAIDGDPVELSDEDLDRLQYSDDPGNPDTAKRSFREQMALRVAAGITSELFASTEY